MIFCCCTFLLFSYLFILLTLLVRKESERYIIMYLEVTVSFSSSSNNTQIFSKLKNKYISSNFFVLQDLIFFKDIKRKKYKLLHTTLESKAFYITIIIYHYKNILK
uniref:Uncharacterized protein n=1 Tax=Lepeophtheirus salmonis TaxID=72036 RepID=A0A0K2U9G6_LEPSM